MKTNKHINSILIIININRKQVVDDHFLHIHLELGFQLMF